MTKAEINLKNIFEEAMLNERRHTNMYFNQGPDTSNDRGEQGDYTFGPGKMKTNLRKGLMQFPDSGGDDPLEPTPKGNYKYFSGKTRHETGKNPISYKEMQNNVDRTQKNRGAKRELVKASPKKKSIAYSPQAYRVAKKDGTLR